MTYLDLSISAPKARFNLAATAQAEPQDDAYTTFCKRLGFFRLPGKGVALAFGWGELLPIKPAILDVISGQKVEIKAMNSTFGLPKFFAKQIKLLKSCVHLNQDLMKGCNLNKTLKDVKKVFYSALEALVASIKIPLLLDKTNIVDLSEISRKLPDTLDKGATLISLGLASMQLAESSWEFGSFVKNNQDKGLNLQKVLELEKSAKLGIKFIASAVKAWISFVATTSMMFGWYLSPVILVGFSTISLASSIAKKVVCQGQLIFPRAYKLHLPNDPALPA